jgi:hypothetical protein
MPGIKTLWLGINRLMDLVERAKLGSQPFVLKKIWVMTRPHGLVYEILAFQAMYKVT